MKCRLPVVSIGNVVAGGTGKTPLTLKLVKELKSYGKIAILSRGYKGEVEKEKHPLIVCNGNGPLFSPKRCGDEVYLLAQNVPEALIVAGKDRVKATKLAFENGAQIIVLDDGCQHRRLYRDCEIIIVSDKDPFSGGKFLPRGLLRDEPRRLAQASLVVVNGLKEGEDLRKWTLAPIVRVENVTEKITFSEGKEVQIKDKNVGIFCGIANPERFLGSVLALNAKVVATCFFSDHAEMKNNKLKVFAMDAKKKGATMLLCTEKDWVKCKLIDDLSLPIAWVRNSFEIKENQESWDEMIDGLKKKINA